MGKALAKLVLSPANGLNQVQVTYASTPILVLLLASVLSGQDLKVSGPSLSTTRMLAREATIAEQPIEQDSRQLDSNLAAFTSEMNSIRTIEVTTDLGSGLLLDWGNAVTRLDPTGVGDVIFAHADRLREFTIRELAESQRKSAARHAITRIAKFEFEGDMKPDALFTAQLQRSAVEDGSIAAVLIAQQAKLTQLVTQAIVRDLADQANSQEQLKTDLGKVADEIATYKESTADDLAKLGTQMHELRVDVENFTAEIVSEQKSLREQQVMTTNKLAELETNSDFIKEVMFGGMTASQQLEALRGGHYPAKRTPTLEKKLEIAAKLEAFDAASRNYVGNARQLALLAKNLGVGDGAMNDIDTAINAYESFSQATLAIASGGPMGYVAAANIVFAAFSQGSGESAHQQLMKAIEAVNKE